MNKIGQFKGEYSFLSNFYEHPLLLDGIIYPTLEHAFQAAKTDDTQTKRKIAEKTTPGAAKRAGGRRGIIKDFDHAAWEAKKDRVMETLVKIKFADMILARLLLKTGDAILEEGNSWNDTYWGVSLKSGKGQNKLGQILMKIRSQLTSAGESNDAA
jgi:ribA/ribD-fused uncharacterized protein